MVAGMFKLLARDHKRLSIVDCTCSLSRLRLAQTIERKILRTSAMVKPGAKSGAGGVGKPTAKRRSGSMSRLSRSTSKLVSSAMRAKGFAEAEIVTRWAHIVGPELAEASVPTKLMFPRGQRRGATLHIRTESAFAPLLQHRVPYIIELVNRYLGYGAVEKVEVRQGPLTVRKRPKELTKKNLNETESQKLTSLVGRGELSPLKEALKSLGEYVISNDKQK
jgi:hypothetical protein